MTVATATFAFDRQSARSFDADGRMRVRDCVISVAEVNPYYGREIPGRDKLGLDPNTVYDLYRDPAELERAADSFNGLPLMIRHVAQTADEPRKEYIGGTVYNARYDADRKQLRGDLLIMDRKAIDYVESGELADLSSSYRYTPDMSPGDAGGRSYHGRMTNIEGNHVALVEDGRATGAHVADSALNSQPGGTPVDPNENNPAAPAPEAGNADVAKALMLLTQQMEAMQADIAALKGAEAAEAVVPPGAEDEEPGAMAPSTEHPEAVEAAMDAKTVNAAIAAAVAAERQRASGVEQAKRETRADLGDMIAMDDAGDIYRAALKHRGADVDAVPKGAERAVYQALNNAARPVVRANDSRSAERQSRAFDTSHIRYSY